MDASRLRGLLRETPVLAGQGMEEEPRELPTEGAGLETLTALASQLAETQTLAQMRDSGRAGLLLLTDDEVEQAFDDVEASDTAPSDRWLEAQPVGNGRWVIYPQDEAADIRVTVWLPVASTQEVTRLVPLDTGVDIFLGTTEAPAAVSHGCDPGFAGYGQDLRYLCVGGDCPSSCEEKWQYRHEKSVLVSCPCR